ncbi:MAG: hypothetical protein KGL15_00690 [Acidobacteriota bacterium]|nr:hypothetical protein [Acidobacteriota bacterium]
MSRSFWPVGEAAQADYERLRGLALAGTPAVDPAARRFERHGLWGLIACPQTAPIYAASVVGAQRAAWSPYQDLREVALADGYRIIMAACAAELGEEQTG